MSAPDRSRPPAVDSAIPLSRGIALLEASAGTGKTYCITNLVVRLIAEQGVPIDRILVVTFTRAATAELRERTRRRLGQAVAALERASRQPDWQPEPAEDELIGRLVAESRAAGPETVDEWLRRLRAARERFDEAPISTIHGFCQRTLLHSALESRADFDAELVQDLSELLEELVDDFSAVELRRAPAGWLRQLSRARIDRADLLDLAKAIEADRDARLLPELPTEADPVALWRAAADDFVQAWQRSRDQAVDLLVQAAKDGAFANRKTYNSRQPNTRAAELDQWLAGQTDPAAHLSEVADSVTYFAADRISGELARGAAPLVHPVFDAARRFASESAEAFKLGFARQARRELVRRKRARNSQSFQDLLYLVRDGLERAPTRGALRESIRARYQAALIDEFQDTDPVQWAIFREVFAEHGWLYLIGDPKQAIYAFRGADVFTYLAARAEARGRVHTLGVNWRADGRYLAALHHLFGQRGGFGESGIEYVPVRAAPQHATDRLRWSDGARPPLQIRFFDRRFASAHGWSGKRKNNPCALVTKGWLEHWLPAWVAADIVALLDSGATLQSGPDEPERPLGPGDIAVLVRKHSQASRVQQALARCGLPAVVSASGSVLASAEAEALQRLLEALLQPAAERPIRAALSSKLVAVRAVALATMDEPEWNDWVARLSSWSRIWRERGVAAALRQISAELSLPARLLGHADGERAMTNLLHLGELLHAAESREQLGPAALAAWLREKRGDDTDGAGGLDREEAELRLESDAEAVQIVTIHRSKGLEYPVVFCPYLWDGALLQKRDIRHLRFHDPARDHSRSLDLGLGGKAQPKASHLSRAERERQCENLRLAYVALTRARHRAVLYWGPVHDAATSPLGSLLHSGAPPETEVDRLAATAERLPGRTDRQLWDELCELAHRSRGTIELTRIQAPEPRSWQPPDRAQTTLAARRFSRQRLSRGWRSSSFSALVSGRREPAEQGSPEAEGRDPHVDEGARPSLAALAQTAELVPLCAFPRGAEAGTFLHRVLELCDFALAEQPERLRELVGEQLRQHRIAATWQEALCAALRAVLHTPLGQAADEASLAHIARADRLDELGFALPVQEGNEARGARHGLSAAALANVFARHRDPDGPLDEPYLAELGALPVEPPLRGFLNGSIDLVFRHRSGGRLRWFLVDYKSNWLGEPSNERSTVYHYHQRAMTEAMAAHHYYLQYHLYTVALHRYLKWRLPHDYDYERDFGGVFYLFLRGMIGADAPRDAEGRPLGVFFDRPPSALVYGLDELLRGSSETARSGGATKP